VEVKISQRKRMLNKDPWAGKASNGSLEKAFNPENQGVEKKSSAIFGFEDHRIVLRNKVRPRGGNVRTEKKKRSSRGGGWNLTFSRPRCHRKKRYQKT